MWMASSAAWSARIPLAKDLVARWHAARPKDIPIDSTGIDWVTGDIALAEGRYAGRNFENCGQADSAAKYYQSLLDLWKNAEPSPTPKKNAVRAALARLSGEKGTQMPLSGTGKP